jgi:thymidylate synthase ThyX
MSLDGVTILLAYELFRLCPQAGGQESSTRYIKMDSEGVASPEALGMFPEIKDVYYGHVGRAFARYEQALMIWESVAKERSDLVRIPDALLADSSKKAKLAVERIRRNYAFDRARYFLPVVALTNVFLVQSARCWVTLCQHLLSHPWYEARTLGALIAAELELVTPRLVKHARYTESFDAGQCKEFQALRDLAIFSNPDYKAIGNRPGGECGCYPALQVFAPGEVEASRYENAFMARSLLDHDNRYAYIGSFARRTLVRFSWSAVSFAEVRDLNRHRTGEKCCPLVPKGFYCALDQLPQGMERYEAVLRAGGEWGHWVGQWVYDGYEGSEATAPYRMLLGHQLAFEHSTTADKFLYEMELRTGAGAHFRYAKHCHDLLALWFSRYPETREYVTEGKEEPE